MSSLLRVLRPNVDHPQRAVSAILTKDASSVTVGLRVRIPAFDLLDEQRTSRTEWGPCPWTPLVEPTSDDTSGAEICRIVWPKKGDLCLLVFDQEDRPWVPCYWPKSYERLPIGPEFPPPA